MSRSDSAPQVSVVVPVFQEAATLDALFARLVPVVRSLPATAEIVVVDDGSTDGSAELLAARVDAVPELVLVRLARNAGQHAAILAGFAASRGAHVVTLDADLQNPPEEIPRLVALLRDGHDLVGTIRLDRQDTWFRRTASRWVNRLTRAVSGIPLRDFGSMLRGYSGELAHELARRDESFTFIPALAYVHARSPVEIEVAHEARHAGRSKYSLLRLIRLQIDLMTGFSLAPIRLLLSLGILVGVAGIGLGLVLAVLRLVHGPDWAVDGVFTLFAVLFAFLGAQFVALGLIGEYVGRTLGAVRRRPSAVVRDVVRARASTVEGARADTARAPAEVRS